MTPARQFSFVAVDKCVKQRLRKRIAHLVAIVSELGIATSPSPSRQIGSGTRWQWFMRDRPLPPAAAKVLANGTSGDPLVFRRRDDCLRFLGYPGVNSTAIEDVIMEFDEMPEGTAETLAELRAVQGEITTALGEIYGGPDRIDPFDAALPLNRPIPNNQDFSLITYGSHSNNRICIQATPVPAQGQ